MAKSKYEEKYSIVGPEDHAEVRRYFDQVDGIYKAPLGDRREAAEKWFLAMRDNPKVVGEGVRWLLNGSYGRGAHLKAQQVAAAKGMNRIWHLGNMIAELEWQCPGRMATEQWKKLTPQQQKAVNREVAAAILVWEEEEGIKQTPVRGVSGYLRESGYEGGRPRTSRAPRLTR